MSTELQNVYIVSSKDIRFSHKLFGASEPQKCLVLWLVICRTGKMNAAVGKVLVVGEIDIISLAFLPLKKHAM